MASDSSPVHNSKGGTLSPDFSSPPGSSIHPGRSRGTSPSSDESDDVMDPWSNTCKVASPLLDPDELWGPESPPKFSKIEVEEDVTRFLDYSRKGIAYMKAAEQATGNSLEIDAQVLYDYDGRLYENLINYPSQFVAIFSKVLTENVLWLTFGSKDHQLQARFHNLRNSTPIKDLNQSDIDKMVSLKGMIVHCSSAIPNIREAVFKCPACHGFSDRILINRGAIIEPRVCGNGECQARDSMILVPNKCRFEDTQIVMLQETRDDIQEGGVPQTMSLVMYDELIDAGKLGDRVEVTGIHRAMAGRSYPSHKTTNLLCKTYIQCLHLKKQDHPEYVTNVEKLVKLSRQPDIYERLARSLAPHVRGLEDIKKGFLCQLFGGNEETYLETGENCCGDIHILLVGDPGTSESQLLQYIHKLSPHRIYTSDGESYAAKEADTGEAVLESGALVPSDRHKTMLHEVMEQQTVSKAKDGTIISLNARTSITHGNPNGPHLFMIDLPSTLLSRFDLIYSLYDGDEDDEERDRHLVKDIIALHVGSPYAPSTINLPTLIDYVSYARNRKQPKLWATAAKELGKRNVELRGSSNIPGISTEVVTAAPGKVGRLLRLSEALARTRFSNWVEKQDVIEAFRLLQVSMQQACSRPCNRSHWHRSDYKTGTSGVSAIEKTRSWRFPSSTCNVVVETLQIGDGVAGRVETTGALDEDMELGTLAGEGFVALHGDYV